MGGERSGRLPPFAWQVAQGGGRPIVFCRRLPHCRDRVFCLSPLSCNMRAACAHVGRIVRWREPPGLSRRPFPYRQPRRPHHTTAGVNPAARPGDRLGCGHAAFRSGIAPWRGKHTFAVDSNDRTGYRVRLGPITVTLRATRHFAFASTRESQDVLGRCRLVRSVVSRV